MSTPVRSLSIYHPSLASPVKVDLPESSWDLFPEGARGVLDQLDADDSGELVYNLDVAGGPLPDSVLAELTHTNDSTATFRRIFWAFEGDQPHNDFKKDRETYPNRLRISEGVQDAIFKQVVGPLLSQRLEEEDRWTAAERIMVTFGDARHLYAIAQFAMDLWAVSKDRKFLDRAEHFLLEAKRIASDPRHLRRDWFGKIDVALQLVSQVLDRFDDDEFNKRMKEPYVMETIGSPATVNVNPGEDNQTVTMRVAVSKGMKTGALIDHFTYKRHVTLTPSRFEGETPNEKYYLLPVEVVREGKSKRPVEEGGSFVREESLDEVLFGKDMDYYQVTFTLLDGKAALGSRRVRKFDLLTGDTADARRIEGGVVLQNLSDVDTRIVFAADTHVNERDYVTKKTMVDSLRRLAAEKGMGKTALADSERVERFYRSFNENLEVMVEEWNALYRAGEIHRVDILGDLADYINIAFESRLVSFRRTNVRRLVHILSKIEAPLLLKAGNHDFHIVPYARSEHKQGFGEATDLYKLYAEHSDLHEFGTSSSVLLKLYSMTSLLCRSGDVDGKDVLPHFFSEAAKEALADDAFFWQPDEGMHHHYKQIDHEEVTITRMGNTYVADLQTWLEHFNGDEWRFEELHPDEDNSLIGSFVAGVKKYVLKQHVNGKGYRPDAFVYFTKQAYKIRDAGGNLVVTGHYPEFYLGSSAADGTPLAEDSLKGNPNWAIRLLTYHLNHGRGARGSDPVIDLVVSGHVHTWGEFDFDFSFNHRAYDVAEEAELDQDFKNELLQTIDRGAFAALVEKKGLGPKLKADLLGAYEEGQKDREEFLKSLTAMFDAATKGKYDDDPLEFYEEVHALRHEYHLDQRIVIRQAVKKPDAGFPGGIVRSFNANSDQYGREQGTLFVNMPAAGPPSVPGYAILTIRPNGSKTLEARSLYRKPDGTLIRANRLEPKSLEERKLRLGNEWRASHGDKPLAELKEEDTATGEGHGSHGPVGEKGESVSENAIEILPSHPIKEFEFVPLSVITQAGYTGFEVVGGPTFNLSSGENSGRIGAQLTLPISHRHYSLFGPNNVFLEAAYDGERDEGRMGAGVNLGLVTPIVRTQITDPTDLEFGLRLFGQSAVLAPAPELSVDLDGNVRAMALWRITFGESHGYGWLPRWMR